MKDLYSRETAYNSYLNFFKSLPDPDKVLTERGLDISVYRDLSYDPHVEACMTSREAGVLQNEWIVEPVSNRGQNRKAVDFITEIFKNIDIERVFREILEAVYFGYAVLEKKYKRDGGSIVFEDIVGKPQEWFRFDTEGRLRFLSKSNMLEGEIVDMQKVELVRYRSSYRNPYGERKLARIFWTVAMKKGGMKWWLQFAEKYGSVFMYARVSGTTEDIDKKKYNTLQMLDDMVNSAVGVFGVGDEIETLNFDRSGNAVFQDLIAFCNAEISKAILGQTLTTQTDGKTGTYAQAKVHQEVRKEILDADKKMVTAVMNRLIWDILSKNFNLSEYPVFTFYEEEDIQNDRAERDTKLKQVGVSFTKQYFIENYNMKETDFEVSETPLFPENTPQFSESKKKTVIL
ncbi:MAG: hypothetical protein A2Y41_07245 [Spirochaetes bacterium GWB1_36_13]|nr:MAG: hypothetical protein A2Y41_07245 [Spirochaetes bacterium GWB1_36_13]